ncbi:MAG TPA: MFS transporter, partial [Polyangiaceae bacterium]|nr:MFS transporter [Polyangiaceae bacterium]
MTSLTSEIEGPPSADASVDALSPPSDKVPIPAKAAYALGGTTDIFGHWLYNQLASPVFNVILGLTPTQVSTSLGVSRLIDAFTDPLFGWLSDNTRSRWGRRRPYILIGSILAGIALPCVFMASSEWSSNKIYWFMIISACIYAPIISAYNMPYQSLGAELTPDYNERTAVLSWRAVVQKIASALLGVAVWLAAMHRWDDPVTGKATTRGAVLAAGVAGVVMIISGIANFVFVRERYYVKAQKQERVSMGTMWRATFSCKPYLVLLGIALVYAIPTGLIGSLGFYVGTYYVYHGDMAASTGMGVWAGWSYAICGVAGVPAAAGLAKRFGKPKALTCTLLIGLVAFASSWWLYTPDQPWLMVLQNGLNGFSATGLWVVLPSMCIDVVDFDELSSKQRREGAYSSTFSWVLKFGMSASMFIVGPLLDDLSGFDAKLGGNQSASTLTWMRLLFTLIPTVALVAALILIHFYPLSRERMHQ